MAFEMKGNVRVQGRPGHESDDDKNWCYAYLFVVNTNVPICDMSITTEDSGASFWLGALSMDPDINPECPKDSKVKDGISIRRGKFADGNTNGIAKGTFIPDKVQPNATENGENNSWNHEDTTNKKAGKGPLQPGGWRRSKIGGELPDPKESTDEMKVLFEPCFNPGEGFEIRLCFDEQLDENDFITFNPTDKSGSSIVGGDTKPASVLSPADLLKLLGTILSTGSKLGMKKESNENRRIELVKLILEDPKLRHLVSSKLEITNKDDELLSTAIKRVGLGVYLDAVSITDIIDNYGTVRILEAIDPNDIVNNLGLKMLVKAIRDNEMETDIKILLES